MKFPMTSILILGLSASSFLLQIKAEDYLIKNATLHTASDQGVLENSDIFFSDGFIMQIGKNLKPSGNYQTIDASGKQVTPGLINASTQIGLVEIDAASSSVDSTTQLKQQGASFSIAPAIHFASTVIPQNRINGLTRAIVKPVGGTSIFHGQGSAIALLSSFTNGLTNKNSALYASYGIAGANISGGSRASAYTVLDQALSEANYLRHNRNRYLPGFDWHFSQSVQDLDALKQVLEKKIPLVIQVHRSDDILQMIALAKKHDIRLVISGASEAWQVADQLAQANVAVIMDPIMNLPGSFEALAVRLDGAAILNRAGVKLAFTGIDWQSTHNAYLVRQSAGNAVAYGLPAEEGLKAISRNTAEIFGIENYGQIKVGMQADLVIWDGDPLEITSMAEKVFIMGQQQPMVSRATRLRDRYWELDNISQKAYTR
ncbi:MAG: amidohydrolase family protein [Enterobacterales bacterium]|nr:amidohydrolase family protein [Enterobacterales bacterium]